MKRYLDLGIAHRVGIGFALLLVLLVTLAGIVLSRNAASARAQEAFTWIIPLTERADALERSVLTLAIRLRSFLLEPDAERLAEYEASIDQVRAALDGLRHADMGQEGRQQVAELAPLVDQYVRATDRLAAERGQIGAVSVDQKVAINSIREEALAAVRRFQELQDDHTQAALELMAAERRNASTALLAASGLAVLFFLVFAVGTIQAVRRPAVELLTVAGALEKGDWTPALSWAPAADGRDAAPRSEMLRLGRAFGAAAVSLQRRERRLRADGDIASATASSLHKETIAGTALRGVVEYLGAELGTVYEYDPSAEALRSLAHHGGGDTADVRMNEGIPGQAAAEKRTLIVRDIPADTPLRVRFGFDAAAPRTVAAVPITFRGDLLGLLLVASLRDLDDDALVFLERSASQLGVGMHNVDAYATGQRLLRDLRERNDRIQSQNEELQAQHEEIQAQHEEIQAQNDELRHQGEQLRVHAAALREADERKNEFMGVLAHELRNPLAAIASSVFTMRRSVPGGEPARSAQAVVERQTRHLTRLIDDLLDITRVTHGKLRILPERLNLVDLVRASIDDYRPLAETRGLHLELHAPEGPVWVDVDRTRMSQVIGNLLNNSMKFTDPGGRIRLTIEHEPSSGSAAVRVADTGIGLSPEVLPHLFQPFRQEREGEGRTEGGLGLGLALVKALVELHRGTVAAHSDGPGLGTEFVVRVPALEGEHGRPPEDAGSLQSAASPDVAMRILIVEDDADVGASLRTALECEGHVVEVASRGPEALDRAAARVPDVVLCDIALPGMDGYEVARRFRADDRLRRVCLIALSGYASDADRARALEAGFERHMVKPPDFDALQVLFRHIAKGRGAGTT